MTVTLPDQDGRPPFVRRPLLWKDVPEAERLTVDDILRAKSIPTDRLEHGTYQAERRDRTLAGTASCEAAVWIEAPIKKWAQCEGGTGHGPLCSNHRAKWNRAAAYESERG